MRKIKLIMMALVFMASTAMAQSQDPKLEKAKALILEKYPEATIKSASARNWGGYNIQFRSKKFGNYVHSSAGVSRKNQWEETRFYLKDELSKELAHATKKAGLEEIHNIQYVERADGQNHYFIKDVKEYIVLFDDNYHRIKGGVMDKGVELTPAVRKDLKHRFDDPVILTGYSSGNYPQFYILYRRDNSVNQEARVTYTTDGQWVSTNIYMRDYTKLPFELIFFVDEKGGIENFSWIQKVSKPEDTFYDLWFKDGTRMKLDEELNVISKN
ncbi:hypothetical protein [Reichenbachiella versicolor]|uniref:hypothetical protein n=1 Tax=Reichenbachiella versicolor TaxID=1821036 RepID=UPI0013A55FEE|nr:hypothetical protein [Reichenbachiella versicolor]